MQLRTYSVGLLFTFVSVLLLGTVFAFYFSHLVGVDSEYDVKRFLVLGFIWLSSLMLCFVRNVELIRISKKSAIFLTIFLVLAVVSSFASKHPFWSMVEVANIILLIVAFYVFTLTRTVIDREVLFVGVYAGALSFSLLTFIKYLLFLLFSYIDAQSFDIHGLISGYVNVRFFNQLQVMIMPILLMPFCGKRLAKFRTISLIVMSLHWTVMLQTEARGAMLSVILAFGVILYFLLSDIRKSLIIIMVKTVLVGFCLWLVFIILIPSWLMESANFQIRTTSSGRIDFWLYVLKATPENLWLGFGPMSYTWAEGKPLPNAHPHNSVMQLLYEFGVIAFTIFSVWVFSRVYNGLSLLKNTSDVIGVPILYAGLSGLIYSLFSGIAVMPFSQLLLVFLIAMHSGSKLGKCYKIRALSRVTLFFMVTLLVMLMLSTYKHGNLLSAQYPRVWLNGLISY